MVKRLCWLVAAVWLGCSGTRGDVLVTLSGVDGGSGADAGTGTDGALNPDASAACDVPPDCPSVAIPGTLSVCGRVIDLATSQPLANDGTLMVSFFNFVDFGGAPSLASVVPDACGRFVAENIFGVLPGFLVMSADDGDLGGGPYVRVVSVIDSNLGQVVRTNAYALLATREQTWSQTSGFAGNFSDIGALVPIFVDVNQAPVGQLQGAPVAGVTITENGSPVPSNDYYFAAGSIDRETVDPGLTETGADGSGILVNALVGNDYSGTKTGCTFASVEGLLFGAIQVQELLGTCN